MAVRFFFALAALLSAAGALACRSLARQGAGAAWWLAEVGLLVMAALNAALAFGRDDE